MRSLLIIHFSVLAALCFAQNEIPLYDGKIPNSKDPGSATGVIFNNEIDNIAYNVSIPTLTAFLPSKEIANGTAVIICPGGGYHLLVIERGGSAGVVTG